MAATTMGPGALLMPMYQAADQSFKTEGGRRFKRVDYAYNEGSPSEWRLRLTNTPGGAPDPHIVGAAVAALGKGFRGNKVEIPADKRAHVKARVLRAWKTTHPGHTPEEIPAVLKADADVNGVAPPGWEKTVKKMKKSGDIDNPFALAWYMKNRGMHPAKHEEDASVDVDITRACAELASVGMPQLCLDAAGGDVYAYNRCLTTAGFVLEARWR